MNDTAIIVHLYYMDMLDELVGYLTTLREHVSFDVIVTTTHPFPAGFDIDEVSFKLWGPVIVPTENRGRDVLPFLKVLPRLVKYRYVCKLHTKHSDEWREHMWRPLMDVAVAQEAKRAIDAGGGLYAPKALWIPLSVDTCGANISNMQKLVQMTGVEEVPEQFVAGTMFWFSPGHASWLSDFDWDNLFEPEAGAHDGKMEHAAERMFPVLIGASVKGQGLEVLPRWSRQKEAVEAHVEGDKAYHRGDMTTAIEWWKKGAANGSEQCVKNLKILADIEVPLGVQQE
jgi:rhamnosyltransferase